MAAHRHTPQVFIDVRSGIPTIGRDDMSESSLGVRDRRHAHVFAFDCYAPSPRTLCMRGRARAALGRRDEFARRLSHGGRGDGRGAQRLGRVIYGRLPYVSRRLNPRRKKKKKQSVGERARYFNRLYRRSRTESHVGASPNWNTNGVVAGGDVIHFIRHRFAFRRCFEFFTRNVCFLVLDIYAQDRRRDPLL